MTRRAWAVGALAGVLGATTLALAASPTELRFPSRNRTYPDLSFQAEASAVGPFRLQLGSPSFALTLEDHRLRLAPEGPYTQRAWLEAEVSGWGRLTADLSVLSLSTRREDDVTLPRQRVAVEALVEVLREPGGYWVTPLEQPASVQVRVDSRTARELVEWCQGSLVLRLAGAPCGELEAALSTVSVPLPPPGEHHWVPETDLTSAERQVLDRYLRPLAPGRAR